MQGVDGNLWDLLFNLLRLFPRRPELADCGWEAYVAAQSSCQDLPRHQINRGLLPRLAAPRLAAPRLAPRAPRQQPSASDCQRPIDENRS